MPRYRVEVRFKQEKSKDITVWADDEEEAEEKACSIVEKWDGVLEADADDVEEIEP